MRAFVDYFVDIMNEKANFNSKIVICQPIESGLTNMINEQEGLYTLYLRGFEKGEKITTKRVISSVSRCINPYENYDSFIELAKNPELRFIVCNTTESGIVYDPMCQRKDRPPSSYPAKLTQFMFERFKLFGHQEKKGFVILSCELIDDNGKELEKCVENYAKLWNLGNDFSSWLLRENIFCSTLVDRIVTGYPKNEAKELCIENQYTDQLIDTAEIFGFWAIEGPRELEEELPLKKAELTIIITKNHKPYKQRKVRILNGAHTSMVLGAYLAGKDIVRDCMEDDIITGFMYKTLQEEIIPTLDLPINELEEFSKSVIDRFKNPFIDHQLLSISLNSTSKWRARVLPSLKKYVEKYNQIPKCLAASLAFYRGVRMEDHVMIGIRNGEEYKIIDDKYILEFFLKHNKDNPEEITKAVCSNIEFWGEDLTEIEGLEREISNSLRELENSSIEEIMLNFTADILP